MGSIDVNGQTWYCYIRPHQPHKVADNDIPGGQEVSSHMPYTTQKVGSRPVRPASKDPETGELVCPIYKDGELVKRSKTLYECDEGHLLSPPKD